MCGTAFVLKMGFEILGEEPEGLKMGGPGIPMKLQSPLTTFST